MLHALSERVFGTSAAAPDDLAEGDDDFRRWTPRERKSP
jgi:hypothetical protein